ncbi:sulfite exporter TauE/SafE family protein, partial [Winkia sp. UMB0889B]|nr:sulfite exporter TauE/SafE family protein [Winkia sp. UMB0889B]
ASDAVVRYGIGIALIVLTLMQLAIPYMPHKHRAPKSPTQRSVSSAFYGTRAGFGTMVANAGSPALTLYMLSRRMDVRAFLGT